MSRSRKKQPWIKDQGNYFKAICNRGHRRICRQHCKQYARIYRNAFYAIIWPYDIEFGDWDYQPWEDGPEFPDRRTIVGKYDICDWKYQDHVKGYRK